jgi:MFS family permease
MLPGALLTQTYDAHPAPGNQRWMVAAGYLFYVAVLAAGYYYNLTFVQLGIIDLGTRLVGLTASQVSVVMAGFAVAALVVAVATGRMMDSTRWNSDLRVKLRILFFVIAGQTLLTVTSPLVETPAHLIIWVSVCSATLGVGMPVTFSLMIDLIPIRHRGAIAAVVAGLAFFAAAVYPLQWRLDEFAPVMSILMAPAVVVMAVLAFGSLRLVAVWSIQHERFGVGRFVRGAEAGTARFVFWISVVLMFSVFFIDSLGFLRIIDTPVYIYTSWQSPELGVRLFIGLSHVLGAAMAGVLYTVFGRRWLFLWILGLFAFTHLLYTFQLGTAPSGIDPPLSLPFFYVLAVSFYTTLNFALWPDLSTPANIGMNTGLGVGIAGWLASFLSTSLALYSRDIGLSLLEHLRYVNALALLLAVGYPVALYLRRMRALADLQETS